MAQRWRTAIARVSFGQALIRLLTALVRVRGCVCVGAAYCVLSRRAGCWRRIGLCDLSPFLRLGVRGGREGPWRGKARGARGEGQRVGKSQGRR